MEWCVERELARSAVTAVTGTLGGTVVSVSLYLD